MMKNFRKYLFIAIILFTIGFIWSNSLKPADDSMNQSNFIKQLFISFFSFFGINIENTFFIDFIRKFAHFFEYFVLGLELVVFNNIYYKTSKNSTYFFFLIGVFVAVVDELIQLIPYLNRSCEFLDVLIDCFGIALAFLICSSIFKIIRQKNYNLFTLQ